MWTFDQLSERRRREGARRRDRARLARARAALGRPARGLHGVVRLRARADPHEPPLRRGLPRPALDAREEPDRDRRLRQEPRRRAARARRRSRTCSSSSRTSRRWWQSRRAASTIRRRKSGGARRSRRSSRRCEDTSQQSGNPLKCEAVTLYGGGQYWLYKYRRYTDVRLVFTPEDGIAAFGGDPDNFQFPRWCLDMALLRAYVGRQAGRHAEPLRDRLRRTRRPASSCSSRAIPARRTGSSRSRSCRRLRDGVLPPALLRASELRGRYAQFAKTSAAAERIVRDPLNGLENSLKVQRKLLDALLDDELMQRKRDEEQTLREHVASDRALRAARRRSVGPNRGSAGGASRDPAAARLSRGRRGLQQPPVPLRPAARPRRRRAAEAEYRPAARVHRRVAAAHRAAARRAGAGLSRARAADAVLFARADARMARARIIRSCAGCSRPSRRTRSPRRSSTARSSRTRPCAWRYGTAGRRPSTRRKIR